MILNKWDLQITFYQFVIQVIIHLGIVLSFWILIV